MVTGLLQHKLLIESLSSVMDVTHYHECPFEKCSDKIFLYVAPCSYIANNILSCLHLVNELHYNYNFALIVIALHCDYMGMTYEIGDTVQPNCSVMCVCRGGFFECRPQRCLVDGPTCYAWGDPHYRSFDERSFDFQGDCEYVLSTPCTRNYLFTITASNTAINSYVSAVSRVTVIIPDGAFIQLSRGGGGTITINGEPHANNGDGMVYNTSFVEVLRAGGHPHVLIKRGDPIKVTYDGGDRVDITPSSSWRGQLCGLCGNYNDDTNDDFILRNGTMTTSQNEFGDSWLYRNTYSTCGSNDVSPQCPADLESIAEMRCNELNSTLFSVCKSAVNPDPYFEACVLDYCQCHEADREDCYCNSLSAYAAACASKGVIISGWRDHICRK